MRLRHRAAAALLGLLCLGCGTTEPASAPSPTTPTTPTTPAVPPPVAQPGPPSTPTPTATAEERVTLPRGGRTVFPRYRLVGYAGRTGAQTLGRLGTGALDQRIREAERRAAPYGRDREVVPVAEVIATVVQASPGRDGTYRVRMSDEDVAGYLAAARRRKALLLLNVQPGRSEFLPEVQAYARWLREPDVGVALDPEWAMDPGQVPGRAYGHTTGRELDGVARYLSAVVREHDLPEKVMVYHQVAASVVRAEGGLRDHPGVAVVKSVDGLGPPGPKVTTYRVVNRSTPDFVHAGFKLFYTEDTRGSSRLMTPAEVLALRPRPEYVLYE